MTAHRRFFGFFHAKSLKMIVHAHKCMAFLGVFGFIFKKKFFLLIGRQLFIYSVFRLFWIRAYTFWWGQNTHKDQGTLRRTNITIHKWMLPRFRETCHYREWADEIFFHFLHFLSLTTCNFRENTIVNMVFIDHRETSCFLVLSCPNTYSSKGSILSSGWKNPLETRCRW